jgi:hypothetical protein
LPRPEQLQLNARTAGVGVAIASVGTAINTGAIAVVTGAGNCDGPAGGGTGASSGFEDAVCAQSGIVVGGHPSVNAKIIAIKPIAVLFSARIVF